MLKNTSLMLKNAGLMLKNTGLMFKILAWCSKILAYTSIHSRRRRQPRRDWRVHSKMPGSCLMVAATLMILFRINWWYVHQVFHVCGIFSSHNSHVWPRAYPHAASLHCHHNALQSLFGRALCMTFWLGLTCYPDDSVHGFTGCFWRKSYQKYVVPVLRGCSSLGTSGRIISHRHLQRPLDCMSWACGLACQVTRPHVNGLLPMGPH
jgi:hypothetical protein